MAPFIGVKYIILVVVIIVIAAAATAFIVYLPSKHPAAPTAQETPTAAPTPTLSPQPSISVSIEKSGMKRSVIIRWTNLPDGTTVLDVFISKTGANKWSLWKTIAITSAELGGGLANFNASTAIAGGGYSFYAEATDGTGSTPIWTSSSTVPVQTSSTTQTSGSPTPSPTPTPAPTSSPTPTPTPSPTPSGSTSTSTQNSSGTVYYSPSGSVSGVSQPQTANFWVEHVNNDLQINWQNIPSDATEAIVYRSASGSGPWTKILDQSNPAVSYSIGIVDNSLNGTYYYKLDVLKGGSIEAEYGPVELAPL